VGTPGQPTAGRNTDMKFTPDLKLANKFKEDIAELGAVLAGMVAMEMEELIRESPQRYGSYVASWYVGSGGGGEKTVKEPPEGTWYSQGSEPAVSKALSTVRRFKAQFSGYGAVQQIPMITVTNPVSYADAAQSQEGRKPNSGYAGDPGNTGSAGHFGRFEGRMRARLAKRIYVGSSTWKIYRDYNV